MLRPLAATAAALIFAACGDSGTSTPSTPSPLSGTLFGQSFTPADESAVVLGQASCTVGTISGSGTGLVIAFGSFDGLCAFATANGTCTNKANATTVELLVVHANISGGTAGPVQPGTYTIVPVPTVDAQGNVNVAKAFAIKTGASTANVCPTQDSEATSGTIKIDSIGTTRVTGSADVTFPDGHVAGTFDVARCDLSVDVCTAASCTAPPCVP